MQGFVVTFLDKVSKMVVDVKFSRVEADAIALAQKGATSGWLAIITESRVFGFTRDQFTTTG
jgi:hypothetical protein